jgi:hypothetical protein
MVRKTFGEVAAGEALGGAAASDPAPGTCLAKEPA